MNWGEDLGSQVGQGREPRKLDGPDRRKDARTVETRRGAFGIRACTARWASAQRSGDVRVSRRRLSVRGHYRVVTKEIS